MNLEGFSATRLHMNVTNMNHPTIAMVRSLPSVLGQCLTNTYSKRIKTRQTRSWELILEIQKDQNLTKEVLQNLLRITEIWRALIMLNLLLNGQVLSSMRSIPLLSMQVLGASFSTLLTWDTQIEKHQQ